MEVPFKLTWHSAGAQVRLSMPLATGLGGTTGGRYRFGLAFDDIQNVVGGSRRLELSKSVSEESANATPRLSMASLRRRSGMASCFSRMST